MIIVKLMGGLGNQMFEYACGLSLATRIDAELKLDHSFFETKKHRRGTTPRVYELGAFGIDLKLSSIERFNVEWSARISRFAPFLGLYRTVNEKSPYSVEVAFPNRDRLILSGYFQSYRYFASNSDLVKDHFRFLPPQTQYSAIIDHIQRIENSVAVLVRRDDYVALGDDFLLKREYYEAAFQICRQRLTNPHFLVFTIGDTQWAKEMFKNMRNVEIFENDQPDLRGFEKMRLISLCRHQIIANSSFGWWSAWLNRNPDKIVIAPRNWVNDRELDRQITENRIPQGWMQL